MEGFNFADFSNAEYEPREADFPVVLDGETVTFRLKGLTAAELSEAESAVDKGKALESYLRQAKKLEDSERFLSAIEGVKEALGIAQKVPDELIRKHAYFRLGVIGPDAPGKAGAVKFAHVYPAHFFAVINKIMALTNQGHEAKKKPLNSGQPTQTEGSEE